MCLNHAEIDIPIKNTKKLGVFYYYTLAIAFAIFSALSGITLLQSLGSVIADIFINLFKCISLPIIFSSIIVTFAQYNKEVSMTKVWQRTVAYTFATTIVAASLACLLYVLIHPSTINHINPINDSAMNIANSNNYFTYLSDLIPTNILAPFLENKVITVLLLSIVIGIATRNIKNEESRSTITHFFKAVHEMLLIITSWIVKIVPLGLYGFMTVTIMHLKSGIAVHGLASYLSIIVLANLIQGFVILPLWLLISGIRPFTTMRGMLPALSVAFFSKSSAGALPITMEVAEKNIGIDPRISRSVLPLCTTINMNGCAAFIFVTVMYLMQSHGIEITASVLISWIFISTIAAIGNAGIPMGCFFLSASLLASMNVPITILGLILPLYSLIDMLETALNVWSDACVAKVVDHKEKAIAAEQAGILVIY